MATKPYVFFGYRRAEAEARKLRRKGYSARVVDVGTTNQSGRYFSIFTRRTK